MDIRYKIFCCTHIDTKTVDEELYQLLQTGRAFDQKILAGMPGDDVGENISKWKDIYDGFLTGLYWIWKNTEYDVVGICGYRSYLGLDEFHPLKLADVRRLFEEEGAGFVVVRENCDGETVEEHFRRCHTPFYYEYLHDPWMYMREVVKCRCPEYIDALEAVLGQTAYNHRNMLIAKREYFDAYCQWLFGLLSDYKLYLEKRNYSIPPRFFGYVAERLQRVWLLKQNIRVKELNVVLVSGRNQGI